MFVAMSECKQQPQSSMEIISRMCDDRHRAALEQRLPQEVAPFAPALRQAEEQLNHSPPNNQDNSPPSDAHFVQQLTDGQIVQPLHQQDNSRTNTACGVFPSAATAQSTQSSAPCVVNSPSSSQPAPVSVAAPTVGSSSAVATTISPPQISPPTNAPPPPPATTMLSPWSTIDPALLKMPPPSENSNISSCSTGSDKELEAIDKTPSSASTTKEPPQVQAKVSKPRKRRGTTGADGEAPGSASKEQRRGRKGPTVAGPLDAFLGNPSKSSRVSPTAAFTVQENGLQVLSPPKASTASRTPPSSSSNSPQFVQSYHSIQTQTELTLEELEQEKRSIEELKQKVTDLADDTKTAEHKALLIRQRFDKYVEAHKTLLIEQSRMERRERRIKCLEDNLRIGQYRAERQGATYHEVFVEGYAYKELEKKQSKIIQEKEDIEKYQKQLKKLKPSLDGRESKSMTGRKGNRTSSNADESSNSGQAPTAASPSPQRQRSVEFSTPFDGFVRPDPPSDSPHSGMMNLQEFYEQDEIYKLRLNQLKKEEAELTAELERLEREKNLHTREIKRIANEDQSRYNDFVTLNTRYLLLSLLGKGGFSEVYKAFDLEEMRYVACKIHHVNPDWREEKKANYVKHALREKDIHKTLSHPRIVKLFEVFTISRDSFCTVLEYCDSNDLDFYLKQHKCIPEKEARSIISQLVSALFYLNEKCKPPIIHYDLKPANILLTSACGEIKITDFGLAKITPEDAHDNEMELTSQFAGTYWYLPPEVFCTRETPKISSRVDVWSVGVIFYQCLYGKKPFGHNLSQQSILEQGTILKATEVPFPAKPAVSNEAKAFIRCCLQYQKEDRADVRDLYHHEYLRPPRYQRAQSQLNARMQQAQQAQATTPVVSVNFSIHDSTSS